MTGGELMYHFIVNPCARSGYGKKVWESVSGIMEENHLDYEVHFTQKSGDGRRLARLAAKACKKDADFVNYVIAIGGDGTVSEVLDGIWDQQQVTFGYIPVGSGNDFCRGMKMPRDWYRALKGILTEAHVVSLYTGRLKTDGMTKHFGVSCGMGFDAHVCYDVENNNYKKLLNRLHLGQFSYVLMAVRLLIMSRCERMKIRIDGHQVRSYSNVLFAAAMNLPYEGGGFMFAPEADGTKPYMYMCVAHGIPVLKRFGLLLLAPKGGHVGHQGVDLVPFTKAEIISEGPKYIHHDGEYEEPVTKLTISIEEIPVRFVY